MSKSKPKSEIYWNFLHLQATLSDNFRHFISRVHQIYYIIQKFEKKTQSNWKIRPVVIQNEINVLGNAITEALKKSENNSFSFIKTDIR